VRSKTDKEPA